MDLEFVKQSMIQLRGDGPQSVTGPVALFNRENAESIIKERSSKPKNKGETKVITEEHVHGHRAGHYITHPCPFCLSGAPCPMHTMGKDFDLPVNSLEEAIKLINSDNERDKMRGLKWILRYLDDHDDIKKKVIDEFGDCTITDIVSAPNWEKTLTRILTEKEEPDEMPYFTPEILMDQNPDMARTIVSKENLPAEEPHIEIIPLVPIPSARSILAKYMEKVLLDSIQKVMESNQTTHINEYRSLDKYGKATWTNTHFIFILDCSGSMKGTRWEAVRIGFDTCLKKINSMTNVVVSAFSFDNKVNPFCKEKLPAIAIMNSVNIPFSGKGTDYSRALEYALNLISRTTHNDYLTCIMFLSDGLGGYPTTCVKKLNNLRESGRKFIFYTIACETDEEEDMIRMCTDLEGEHYKVVTAEASRLVFSSILNV